MEALHAPVRSDGFGKAAPMGILQTEHFVLRDALPTVRMETSAAEALRRMYDSGVGGFIVADDIAPRFYIAGATFADHIDSALNFSPGARDVLAAPLVSILQLVPAEGIWRGGLSLADPGLVPVLPEFLDPCDEASWQNLRGRREHLAAPVVDRLGRQWGWFLNHEDVVRTVHTKPPSYVCSIDTNHRFADPDHGLCRYCPGTLSRAP
jgi:hypothetical protein